MFVRLFQILGISLGIIIIIVIITMRMERINDAAMRKDGATLDMI